MLCWPRNRNRFERKTIMRIRNVLCLGLVLGLFAGCESEKGERGENQAKLMSEAKVSKADAEKIALGRAPNGTVKEGEIEREKGKLIWSFDIATPDSKDITEVNVDALTGQVVSVEKETAKQEGNEKKTEEDDKK